MKELLSVKKLYVKNNDVKILKDISFELNKGEVLGIIGESGSGKSTLLRAITNMLKENEKATGHVLLKNKDILDLNYKEMNEILGEEIGIVYQNPAITLNPTQKIRDQFADLIRSHRKISKKECYAMAVEMLERVGLNDCSCLAHSYPFELSGGMNQRVAIALSMVLKPEILIADEITSALDVTVQKRIVNELVDLKNEFQTSIIMVTHDMGVASYISDKIAVMYSGEIVEYGSKDEVLKNPSHPYTKALINAIPKFGGSLPRPIEGNAKKIGEECIGCNFSERCTLAHDSCNHSSISLRKISDSHYARCTK